MGATIHLRYWWFVGRAGGFERVVRTRGTVWREKKDVEADLEKRESF